MRLGGEGFELPPMDDVGPANASCRQLPGTDQLPDAVLRDPERLGGGFRTDQVGKFPAN